MSVRAQFTVHAQNLAAAKASAKQTADELMGDEPYAMHIDASPEAGDVVGGTVKTWSFEVSLEALDDDQVGAGS